MMVKATIHYVCKSQESFVTKKVVKIGDVDYTWITTPIVIS